ncbi:uncharacterized protein EDB93DRAFT_1096947 [Suillus bovinus]|uniref:uncharacterized protein n=1 Tax=Suillus bovinus TaxID=48563 RepID=UPI001B85C3AC|nr:uncharacterized protein EDB93DRAFT_1096947 [Suillus bovinus]KAG2126864.1 hypothetical protein EDB93DRAFT_1096947 [Suillus bovinus]
MIPHEVGDIVPSDTLTLQCGSCEASYQLNGVIYCGQEHFTACLIINKCVWQYNGQQNNGCPQKDKTCTMDLVKLSQRPALAYIYACREVKDVVT